MFCQKQFSLLQFERPYYIFVIMPYAENPKSQSTKGLKKKDIAFEYFAPHAQAVYVAGTFNDWKPVVSPLKKDKNGKWKATLSLPSGRYEYRYFVDGIWENDQRPVECVPNAFGSWNCVVTVS